MGSKKNVLSGNKISSHVQSIGRCSLVLNNYYVLDLEMTFYIPFFSRNLNSISKRIPLGYSFKLSNSTFNLFYKSKLLGMVLCVMVFSLLIYNIIMFAYSYW